jgi:hypothetical protein
MCEPLFPLNNFALGRLYAAGGDYLSPPTDLDDLFYPPYHAGVRIHSNSWGCDAILITLHLIAFCRLFANISRLPQIQLRFGLLWPILQRIHQRMPEH